MPVVTCVLLHYIDQKIYISKTSNNIIEYFHRYQSKNSNEHNKAAASTSSNNIQTIELFLHGKFGLTQNESKDSKAMSMKAKNTHVMHTWE